MILLIGLEPDPVGYCSGHGTGALLFGNGLYLDQHPDVFVSDSPISFSLPIGPSICALGRSVVYT